MNHDVTREILWNIPPEFVVILYGMLIPLTAAFIYGGMRWYRMERLGQPTTDSRFDPPVRRLFLALRDGIGQGFAGRETWGWMRYMFLVAFIGLML